MIKVINNISLPGAVPCVGCLSEDYIRLPKQIPIPPRCPRNTGPAPPPRAPPPTRPCPQGEAPSFPRGSGVSAQSPFQLHYGKESFLWASLLLQGLIVF